MTMNATNGRAFDYVVYRVGSNAANQSMTHEMAIAVVSAPSREAACQAVRDGGEHTVYANQHLHAVPASKAPRADLEHLREREAMEQS
jgi:hypothetical protein